MSVNRNPPTQKRQAPWETVLCPILTRPPEKRLLQGVAQAEAEATMCQGPNCAWYKLQANEAGQIIGGQCAVAVLPQVVGEQTRALHIISTLLSGEGGKPAMVAAPAPTQSAPPQES